MKLDLSYTYMFPSSQGVTIDDIREYFTMAYGDGIVDGFDISIVGGNIVISPGIAIVDGVMIKYRKITTLPYSTSVDKDIQLVYNYNPDAISVPEIRENYRGESAYIVLGTIMGGAISLAKRKYVVLSRRIEAFGMIGDPEAFNRLITNSSGDGLHYHSGVYRLGTEEGYADDQTIISPPDNTLTILVTPHAIEIPDGATLHCFIGPDNRIRIYTEKDGVLLTRGTAKYTIIKKTYGITSGDRYVE